MANQDELDTKGVAEMVVRRQKGKRIEDPAEENTLLVQSGRKGSKANTRYQLVKLHSFLPFLIHLTLTECLLGVRHWSLCREFNQKDMNFLMNILLWYLRSVGAQDLFSLQSRGWKTTNCVSQTSLQLLSCKERKFCQLGAFKQDL